MASITKQSLANTLREVIDPQAGINVLDLGLIYEAWFTKTYMHVNMTLTSSDYPLAGYLTEQVRSVLRRDFPELSQVEVSVVWQPPWSPKMITAAARH